MKKARKKFEIKDVKNAGSRTKSSGLFHRYFYVTVLILFIGFTILGSSLLIFIARYQSEEKTALLKQNAQTVSQTAAALIQKGYSLEESNKNSTLLMSVSTAQLSQAIDADIYICDTDGKIICCKDIWQSNLVMYMGEHARKPGGKYGGVKLRFTHCRGREIFKPRRREQRELRPEGEDNTY